MTYKVGMHIKIKHLDGEDTRYDGKSGVIESIDSMGQLHGTWGGLAVIPGVDSFIAWSTEELKDLGIFQ